MTSCAYSKKKSAHLTLPRTIAEKLTHIHTQMASSLEQIGPHDLVFSSVLDTTVSYSLPFRELICQMKISTEVLVKHNYRTLSPGLK